MSNGGKKGSRRGRRRFLKDVALGAGAMALPGMPVKGKSAEFSRAPGAEESVRKEWSITYPRVFTGARRKMLSFPLGGVGAGSIGLGGRGELREWWIFHRPDKGNSPQDAFPSLWARDGHRQPSARVLEARIMPPYEGASGLGSANTPGLPRLATSTFVGEYPLARVDFDDPQLPVKISLEAFTPFIRLNPTIRACPLRCCAIPFPTQAPRRPASRSLFRLIIRWGKNGTKALISPVRTGGQMSIAAQRSSKDY